MNISIIQVHYKKWYFHTVKLIQWSISTNTSYSCIVLENYRVDSSVPGMGTIFIECHQIHKKEYWVWDTQNIQPWKIEQDVQNYTKTPVFQFWILQFNWIFSFPLSLTKEKLLSFFCSSTQASYDSVVLN